MKIGIFGGSFNPPHKAHLEMGTKLVLNHILDRVIYVPTGSYYPKAELARDDQRFEMLKLLTRNYPFLEVSSFELQGNLIYTYQTLNYFKQKYHNDEIYFILGSDLLKEIMSWKNSSYILEHFKILVTLRNEDSIEDLKQLALSNHKNIMYTNIQLDSLSSTEIRKNLKQHNLEFLEKNMDHSVLEYIKKNHLYEEEK